MLKSVANKANTGNLLVNLAREHLYRHEWGEARMALETGLAKGSLDNLDEARKMLLEIYAKLDLRAEEGNAGG
jgi:hypothetical protein